ncbi:MAG: DUF3833 domain-containing protein [Roseinatronobacter sp.]
MTPLLTFAAGMAAMMALYILIQRFTGFPAQRPEDYAGTGPAFDLRKHLSGPMRCEGVIYGPMGRVSSRFSADMEGRWDGNRGTLAEHFRYDSGTTQDREWRLAIGNDGAIRAEADDLVGVGTGRAEGAALRLQYTIRLPQSAGGHALDVTDWLYLVDDRTIVNRSQFRKFGVKVAELVATMRKVEG